MYNKSTPQICIAHNNYFPADKINEIEYGIEEEGLFSKIALFNGENINTIAAKLSCSVSTGVCLAVGKESAVLAYEKCGADFPVLSYDMEQPSLNFFRILGKNAARLVKGLPFI